MLIIWAKPTANFIFSRCSNDSHIFIRHTSFLGWRPNAEINITVLPYIVTLLSVKHPLLFSYCPQPHPRRITRQNDGQPPPLPPKSTRYRPKPGPYPISIAFPDLPVSPWKNCDSLTRRWTRLDTRWGRIALR